MEHFLINSTACLFVLWLFYKLVLENTSWHHWKRYYLLGSISIALILPFIVVETIVIPVENSPLVAFANSEVITGITSQTTIEEPAFQINWTLILQLIYGLGVLIMLWRFVKNLRTFRILDGDEVNSYAKYQLVLRHVMTVPHSFLQRIFVSKKQFEKNLIPTTVLEHEKAHLDQRHSLDILFIEFLMIIFWFNPLFYILRYSITLNHEFLADRAVIEQGTSTTQYQETLLQYTSQSHSATLANTFNFPIIKKRFHIMKTQTSSTSLLLRSLALVPVLTLLVMSCGKKEEIRKIDHSIDLSFSEDANMVYGVDIDGNIPEGTTFYNGVEYSYKVNEDFTANLFYPDGEEVDTEANQLHLMIQFDAVKEVEKLKRNEKETIKKIESGLLKIEEITSTKTGREIRELDYQELITNDFTGDYFYKKKIGNIIELSFHVFPSMQNNIEIPIDQDTGFIQIFGNPFSFEKRNDSIIIKNKKGKIFDWKKAGFKIIERKLPPPEPLKAQGYMKVDEKIYYYTTKDGDNNFYDRKGNIIDIKGKKVTQVDPNDLPPPPPPAKNK